MCLTNDDIVWYDPSLRSLEIIDCCGEFSNVPLIGTQGGVNYNLAFARRQLGFPLRDKPNNTLLEGLFYQDGKDPQHLKHKIVHAWHNVHMKGRSELGPCSCVALEAYTLWVKKRALELKMPYACERPMSMVVAEPLTLPNQDVEELEDALAKMKQEKDKWEESFHALSRKHEDLQLESKDNDTLIELLEDRVTKRQREPEVSSSSSMPQSFVAWKKIVDHIVLEKTQMKASFETEIRRFEGTKLTHQYNTHANHSKIMEHLEQENRALKDEIARLTTMMESVLAAQSEFSPTSATPPPQRTVISEVATSTIPATAAHLAPNMHAGFPWGMPPNFVPEGFAPTFASMLASSLVMYMPPLVMHTLPRMEDTIYHFEPSEGPDVCEKMDEMKDQFLELCKELKTLRGKDMFGKSVTELFLVPNVKIPMKFKVSDFEKYKGNTCPPSHLVMYARKMSTQTDNDQLLFHYFQGSLIGATLRWYMGLDSASIRTLNDLGEAFVKQYKYNVDMAPDRDQLRSLSQKDKETFKEEMTKIFLKTLSSFYYERMIASAPSDFTEMVNMGMRLEEGVREGWLSKEEVSSNKRIVSIFGSQEPVATKKSTQILEPLPWWYKSELRWAFHQGAPGHDIDNCYPLMYKLQKLVKSGMVSFEDRAPNVKANPLPANGNSSVNMVDSCPREFKVFDVRFIRRSLVRMHKDIFLVSDCEHDHDGCAICNVNPRGCMVVKRDFQSSSNSVSNKSLSSLVIRLAGPVPYASDKVVQYQYNATMLENGQEVPLSTTNFVVSITDVIKVTRSGRVFGPVFPKNVEDISVSKKVDAPVVDSVSAPKFQSGGSSSLKPNDDDEVLRLTKKSEFNMLEHRFFIECDSKSTLSRLSYQGDPMRYSGVIVKAFDGSRKTVIGEVGLPVKIGPSDFQITFQVMDIYPTYSYLLGRPWIHEERSVTPTLHEKLKFVKSGKLVIVGGEKALLVSLLSSISYVEAEDEVGTPFQGLSITEERRVGAPMSSFKDAKKIVEDGQSDQWGQMVEVSDNKSMADLGSNKVH
ncbi:hypothetical protein KIW84_055862 [Lathyrus oleraceus]|uniref:DUF7745 domain-containing protein n=1 Tax=Pisum sativum TaxID=3888 RepID=A0A9D5AG85_PEA|nr:hypothetical protein KIW84_055862 [Pisum sativum]